MIPTNTVVTIERRDDSAVDDLGNPRPSWNTIATVQAWLEQTAAVEVTEGADTAVSDWLLVTPRVLDVHARDRVSHGQDVLEVVGRPDVKRLPGGVGHHTEARLRLVG